MNHLYLAIIFNGIFLSTSVLAGQTEYDDCILKYLKGAKLDVATHLIKQACDENFKNPSFTSEKKFTYNNCLLEHLPGIESLQAAMNIKAACSSKYK